MNSVDQHVDQLVDQHIGQCDSWKLMFFILLLLSISVHHCENQHVN